MSDKTGIEWTDATWNPVTGCDKVSDGCTHCYADTIAHRFAGTKAYPNGFQVTLRPDRLDQVLRWRRPRRIFVNSMSDLFHDQVPDEYIARVFAIMAVAQHHTFQILTKRHARMRSLLSRADGSFIYNALLSMFTDEKLTVPAKGMLTDQVQAALDRNAFGQGWPLPNVWLGVSTENQKWASIRIPALLDTPAAIRFISAEPLLGPISLHPYWTHGQPRWGTPEPTPTANGGSIDMRPLEVGPKLDWVIVGGESGLRARPMHPQWARSLRAQCEAADIPFLFKQWGEWGPAPWKLRREPDEFTLDYKARAEANCATHAFTGGMYQDDSGAWVEHVMEMSHKPWSVERAPEAPQHAEGIRRWGKKNAGRELDGRTWDEFPDTTAAVSA